MSELCKSDIPNQVCQIHTNPKQHWELQKVCSSSQAYLPMPKTTYEVVEEASQLFFYFWNG